MGRKRGFSPREEKRKRLLFPPSRSGAPEKKRGNQLPQRKEERVEFVHFVYRNAKREEGKEKKKGKGTSRFNQGEEGKERGFLFPSSPKREENPIGSEKGGGGGTDHAIPKGGKEKG